jgi:hypothetical protein
LRAHGGAALRALTVIATQPKPLTVPVVANDTEASRGGRVSGEYPAAPDGLLTPAQRARIVETVRPAGSSARSPEVYAAMLEVALVPAPWLPERCPGLPDEDEEGKRIILYRPDAYSNRAQIVAIANELAARSGVEVRDGDLRAMATALAEPPRRIVMIHEQSG